MIKAILAGLFIALGAMGAQMSPDKYIGAAVFPVGLILCYFVGANLFTGKNLMIMDVINRKRTVKDMISKLALFWTGNLIGAGVVGATVYITGIISNTSNIVYKVSESPAELIVKGIFCNICVCLAVYGAAQSKSEIGKLALLYFPTFLFVLCGFEHCVANMYYLTAIGKGLLSAEFWYVQGVSLIGNLIGGLGIGVLLCKKG